VIQVKHGEVFDEGRGDGKPKEAGLMDLRMGTMDARFLCETCGGNMNSCAGHFGHIELSAGVYHVAFMTSILQVLRCVCFFCSKILCDEEFFDRVNKV